MKASQVYVLIVYMMAILMVFCYKGHLSGLMALVVTAKNRFYITNQHFE